MPKEAILRPKDVPLLAADRHRQIVALVDRQGSVRAVELARMFKVTHETIRLDLERLEQEGLLVRRHGGAMTLHGLTPETPFSQRETELVREKAAIARAALEMIEEGDTILLDASSSTWRLASLLPDIPLTVISPAVKVVVQLANHRHVRVISTGGTLSSPSLSFVGPMAERTLREYHVDKCFVSCSGLDMNRGVSESHEWQATLKTVMLEQSDTNVLMIDHSKFNVRSLAIFAAIQDFNQIITDSGAPPQILKQLSSEKLNVRTVTPVD